MLARAAAALVRGSAERSAHLAAAARAASTSAPGGAGIASGVPADLLKREVVIYAPARTPSQQGMSNTATSLGKGGAWRIEFETKPKWVNPLMGWTSTADPYENVGRAALSFDTADAAAAFCEAHGWTYTIRPPAVASTARPRRYQQYGDNFSVRRYGIPEGGLVSESGLAEAAGVGGGGEGGGSGGGGKKGATAKAAAAKKKGGSA